MPLPLDPNCPCCQLAKQILDITEGHDFADIMASLTNVLARKLYAELAEPGACGPGRIAIQSGLAIIERQVTENLAALGS